MAGGGLEHIIGQSKDDPLLISKQLIGLFSSDSMMYQSVSQSVACPVMYNSTFIVIVLHIAISQGSNKVRQKNFAFP